ncbi:MAG TPA: GGDEF domain-containing protein [Thermoanaerobaculia bacterium]|nr:GGDEF domain-containing protein [Thermoanaerobaculia bacterium]
MRSTLEIRMIAWVPSMAADEEKTSSAELQRLVALIQELASRATRSESVTDVFSRGFPTLHKCMPFDLAVAVMLEQNLDLYITAREGAEDLVNERLVERIRRTLESCIPVSFATTEVIVKSEEYELPSAPHDDLRHDVAVVLHLQNRAAGVLLLARSATPFREEERKILEIFSTQVSMLLGMIRARERIVNLADTDDLTGIWNKRFFRRQLPQEIERARTYSVPLSLLLFDIDDFKQINDSFGHIVGDVVLSELCGAVRESLRPPDFIARFGGDEFAVILPHTDLSGAVAVAERILTRVRSLTIPTDEESAIRCSISIGAAEYHFDDATANDFVRRADEKLYTAKRQGKNRYTA